ncbi:glycosyltransferase [Zunongwangia sp. F260]|uniref:Glycosyltransferase n=1 Tax=Autumnicola lenta TaxID=3075593 RepID=A0ABU3CHT0_9FLAO|nr:glycosyltransferase [Zunongwangia sp. F260]MDT0645902.1 glycosyltransferase [Zunongwangia sp. F260]
MDKIKILHIIKSLGRGGAEVLLPETLKLHNQSQFEFHYIYFLPWKNQMVEAIEKTGGKVTCLKASNNLSLLGKSSDVINYCRKYKIDLIHCHLPWSGFLGRIVAKRTNIPVIYTEHNIQEHYHIATKTLNKFSFNFQALALGVSEDATQSIINNIKPKIPVRTVLNGVNTDFFIKNHNERVKIRHKHNIPDDACVIGNIAVFREQKAIPVWLKAFKKINKKHPEVYGLLVGAGPKEDEVKALVKEYNLSDKIILPGLQTDTLAYFSAIDIFMMSSAFEGLPIALLEAMSMECAVVSTKAGGVVEVVENEISGLLCEVGNYGCLAAKASELIEDPEKRKDYQIAARKRVVNNFSLKRMVDELEDIYNSFVKK